MKCWFFKRKKHGKFGINNKSNHIRSISSSISKILYDLKYLKWLNQYHEHQTTRHRKNRQQIVTNID